MEHRDLLKEQIEQLGKVLGKIVAHFLGLKLQGNPEYAFDICQTQLKEQLDLDVTAMLHMTEEELKMYLEDRKLRGPSLEPLSNFFFESGVSIPNQAPADARKFLALALSILNLIDEHTQTLSIERYHQKKKIQTLLKE